MGLKSQIEWTDATWNPFQGCTKVSPACQNCYMFTDLKRYGRDGSIVVRSKPPTFNLPLKKRKTGEYAVAPDSKVFTCSWSDWFHVKADPWRAEAWEIIRKRPDVTFQIVTKRTERIAECLPSDWGNGWPNVWLIATVENQEWADVRIPQLLSVPAVVHGLSCEPLLGPIKINVSPGSSAEHNGRSTPVCGMCSTAYIDEHSCHPKIKWVIAGGESGHHARPYHPNWLRNLRDQCVAARVPFHFKQHGEWIAADFLQPEDPLRDPFAEKYRDTYVSYDGSCAKPGEDLVPASSYRMIHVGKKAAGRILDGRTWDQFPEVRA